MIHRISQTRRAMLSAHTGEPIVQELNTLYGYWGTVRFIDRAEYDAICRTPAYEGPWHPAEISHANACMNTCG